MAVTAFRVVGQRDYGASGSGASIKLVLNMLMGVQMQSLAEAIVLGERTGLPRGAVIKAVVDSGFSSPAMRFKAGMMGRRALKTPRRQRHRLWRSWNDRGTRPVPQRDGRHPRSRGAVLFHAGDCAEPAGAEAVRSAAASTSSWAAR